MDADAFTPHSEASIRISSALTISPVELNTSRAFAMASDLVGSNSGVGTNSGQLVQFPSASVFSQTDSGMEAGFE